MIEKKQTIYKEYVYDFAVDGGAIGEKPLRSADPNPAALDDGLIVKDALLIVEEVVTSGGTPTITFGPEVDPDGYLADVFAKVGAKGTVRVGEVTGALLWDNTAKTKKGYLVGSAANTKTPRMAVASNALTAGKLRLVLELYNPGTSK